MSTSNHRLIETADETSNLLLLGCSPSRDHAHCVRSLRHRTDTLQAWRKTCRTLQDRVTLASHPSGRNGFPVSTACTASTVPCVTELARSA